MQETEQNDGESSSQASNDSFARLHDGRSDAGGPAAPCPSPNSPSPDRLNVDVVFEAVPGADPIEHMHQPQVQHHDTQGGAAMGTGPPPLQPGQGYNWHAAYQHPRPQQHFPPHDYLRTQPGAQPTYSPMASHPDMPQLMRQMQNVSIGGPTNTAATNFDMAQMMRATQNIAVAGHDLVAADHMYGVQGSPAGAAAQHYYPPRNALAGYLHYNYPDAPFYMPPPPAALAGYDYYNYPHAPLSPPRAGVQMDRGNGQHGPFIKHPGINDVLCSRTTEYALAPAPNFRTHPGNRAFLKLLSQYRAKYLRAQENEKRNVAAQVVNIVQSLEPSGRFLEKDIDSGWWMDIGHERTIQKTMRAFRMYIAHHS